MKRVKPNPYGNDAEFKAYIKQGNRKMVMVVIIMIVVTAVVIFA